MQDKIELVRIGSDEPIKCEICNNTENDGEVIFFDTIKKIFICNKCRKNKK